MNFFIEKYNNLEQNYLKIWAKMLKFSSLCVTRIKGGEPLRPFSPNLVCSMYLITGIYSPILLDAPNAVQLKNNCLVSKGNKNGQEWFNSSHQAGKLALLSTNGSWICCRSLLVIFLLEYCSGLMSNGLLWSIVLRSCNSLLVVMMKRWRNSWRTSSTVQLETEGVPGTGVLGDKVVPATELLPLREYWVAMGVALPSSGS